MSQHSAENLARIMAAQGLSIQQVTEKCGLDRRTVQAILNGSQRAHARTLHRLAEGLEVSIDEFFVDPSRLVYRHFDRQTNPMVQELIDAHPEQFADWTEADFAELTSHVGTGGALTHEGALATAKRIHRKREAMTRMGVVLETGAFDFMCRIVDLVYEQVVFHEGQVPGDGDLFASRLVRGAATKPSDCGPEGILPFPGRRGS
jgi:transcriptional regulator with XRE-family HTH domain